MNLTCKGYQRDDELACNFGAMSLATVTEEQERNSQVSEWASYGSSRQKDDLSPCSLDPSAPTEVGSLHPSAPAGVGQHDPSAPADTVYFKLPATDKRTRNGHRQRTLQKNNENFKRFPTYLFDCTATGPDYCEISLVDMVRRDKLRNPRNILRMLGYIVKMPKLSIQQIKAAMILVKDLSDCKNRKAGDLNEAIAMFNKIDVSSIGDTPGLGEQLLDMVATIKNTLLGVVSKSSYNYMQHY